MFVVFARIDWLCLGLLVWLWFGLVDGVRLRMRCGFVVVYAVWCLLSCFWLGYLVCSVFAGVIIVLCGWLL